MATGNINLSVLENVFSSSETYENIISKTQELDNSDGFISLIEFDSAVAANKLNNAKALCIYNESNVCAEIQYLYNEFKDNSNTDERNSIDLGGGATGLRYSTELLPAGKFKFFPNNRVVGYNADASAANATSISNVVPAAVRYVVVDTDGTNAALDDSETAIAVDDGDFFKRGDLIRIDDEIMEVTSISGNSLTVIRGTHGSTKVAHDLDSGAGRDIRLPFFNAYNNFNRYTVAQTNKNGKFKAMNFFGYGRTADGNVDGIVPGSVAFKFYTQAYQEVGLSGITANTNSGLSASTIYYFHISVDGSTPLEIAFTTDSSNVNFGGKNGIINKIQNIFDSQYYTEGHLFEKRVSVSIVDGDLRFTSGSRLSTSAVALTAGTSGTANTDELFDGTNQIGRFPAVVESAVAPKLEEDTIIDKVSNIEKPNKSIFMHDDGNGNLLGAGSGSINYETGSVDFTSFPNAEFVISANHLSAHSGAPTVASSASTNSLISIGGRSTNSKLNSKVKIIVLD